MGKLITCFRCRGLKKVFKIGGAYSLNDCGGQKVDCPLCLGVGEIVPLSAANDEIKEKVKKTKKEKQNDTAIVMIENIEHDEDVSQKALEEFCENPGVKKLKNMAAVALSEELEIAIKAKEKAKD